MMLDGLEIADRTHVVALGISTDGAKTPLGLWEGSTATLVGMLLAHGIRHGAIGPDTIGPQPSPVGHGGVTKRWGSV